MSRPAKKLPSAGLKRGAALPLENRNGPMDLDLLEMEAQAMQAAGIPPQLIPGMNLFGFTEGHPIPGGGRAA
jgi:hypothetical protein